MTDEEYLAYAIAKYDLALEIHAHYGLSMLPAWPRPKANRAVGYYYHYMVCKWLDLTKERLREGLSYYDVLANAEAEYGIDWKLENLRRELSRPGSYRPIEHLKGGEMMHLFVNEMATKMRKDHEERVCTKLAQAFAWVLEQQ